MYNQLTREQRYAIYLGLKEGKSKKAIAQQINVSSSTVSREIKRNSNRHGRYIWKEAQELADVRKERLPGNRKMKQSVIDAALNLLRTEDWSPQQISGHLVQQGIRISHETIYRHIREDYTGELKSHCRHKMKYLRHIRKKRPTKATNIPDRTSIHDRPLLSDGRRFGDWEMDLIIGNGQKSAVLTICERSSNFLLMTPLPLGKKPEEVAKAVVRLLRPYKDHVHTIRLTTVASSRTTNTSHGNSAQPSISLTVTALGRKEPLKMPTNLSVNIFRKEQISGCIQNPRFDKSSIKSTDDHGENLIFPLQRMCSSN